MNVLEKILEEINALKRKVVFDKADNQDYKTGYICALSAAEGIVSKHMDDSKTVEFDFNKVKSFDCQCGRHYVNTYNDGWIPVEERLPEQGNYILLSFDNFSLADIGRYEVDDDGGGAFYPGDEDTSYSSIGFFVNAWRPLPEPYRPKESKSVKNTQQEMEDFCEE